MSVTEDEDIKICVRTEVDAYTPGQGNPQNGQALVTIRALNEFDPRAPGAGGAPDWRSKLDTQRGAVVATEMKNNSCKLAKWTVQSVLAGADLMKIGYVSILLDTVSSFSAHHARFQVTSLEQTLATMLVTLFLAPPQSDRPTSPHS